MINKVISAHNEQSYYWSDYTIEQKDKVIYELCKEVKDLQQQLNNLEMQTT